MNELSLRTFHVVFVIAAALVALGFGLWTIRAGSFVALGALSLAIGLALAVYLPRFLRRTRELVE